MDKIYTSLKDKQEVLKASPETVRFLLDYSKSLKITKAHDIPFETNIN